MNFPVGGIPENDLPRTVGRTGYLYLITNLINGKQYVGQTRQTISRRWTAHRLMANMPNTALSLALRKYGVENFIIEQLIRVESGDLQAFLDTLERQHIKLLNTLWPNGYNLHEGGGGGPLTDEHKQKLRIAHLGKKASLETRAKMSAVRKGRKLSPEHVAAIRRVDRSRIVHRRGFTISEKQRAQVSAVHKGKVLSPETRAKISVSVKAYLKRKQLETT